MCSFTIPGRLPGYNELTKGHWATCNQIKQDAKTNIGWIIRKHQIQPISGKVTISIRCYEPNARRDDDNVTSGAAKCILDALQDCKILKGDGRKYVKCIKYPAEIDRINPRVEVEIREETPCD